MFKDCHVHTKISHDGKSSVSEYIAGASAKGVDEITFTEHYDIYDGLLTKLHTLDLDVYETEYIRQKDDAALKTNFGIEIGLRPDTPEKIRAAAGEKDFDFVIGSSHITNKTDIAMDDSFFDGITQHEAYMRYFSEVFENIKLYGDLFDVYGHIDYVVRYGLYDNKRIVYSEYAEILDKILGELAARGRGIEINTSGIRCGLGSPHPCVEIVKRFKELGGEIVTVGSDAHRLEDLGSYFDTAYGILKEAGFRYTAVFHRRSPEFIRLT